MTDYDVVLYDEVGSGYGSKEALGGSEFAFLKLGDLLQARGYRVKSVLWKATPYGALPDECSTKALICMRSGAIPTTIRADRTIVWAHDAGAEVHRHLSPELLSGRATMVCVSGWQARGMPRAWRKTVIPPMVEAEVYQLSSRAQRDPDRDMTRFLYASGVVKGLSPSLAYWEALHAKHPDLRLEVTAPYGDPPQVEKTPGAEWIGRLSPSEVAERLAHVAGLFYVNAFPETFGTVAAVAEAAGARCHILTLGDPGGLPEAVRGPLLTNNPESFRRAFGEALADPSRFVDGARDLRPETILPRWEKLLGLSTAEPRRATRRNTVGLSMIAKNASGTIARALESAKPFIDSYTILLDDNPADDETAKTIRAVMGDVPGLVVRTPPCPSMAKLRNEALSMCGEDFALILDADDWLEAEPWFEFDPSRDSYEIPIEESGGVAYARTQLVRPIRGFRYEYPAHEVLVDPPDATHAALHGLVYRRDRATSGQAKFLADARALKKLAHRDPRAAFYYAQSLKCAGQPCLMAYKQRVELGGFQEERFISMLEIARVYRQRQDAARAETWYRRAAEEFPARATEPLTELARMCRDAKRWGAAYAFASWGAALNQGPQSHLFVDVSAYQLVIYEELALSAFYLGKREQAANIYTQLLASPTLAKADRPRMLESLAWCRGEDPWKVTGPDGTTFATPDAPEHTRKTCATLARLVFAGEYDAPELPEKAHVILDIGANIGAFAAWALHRWPGSELHAYEPNPKAAAFCERNAKVTMHVVAVTTDRAPRLKLHDDWGMNYTQKAGDAGVEAWRDAQPQSDVIDVPALHPESLPACAILKIDAEGVEPEILENYPHLGAVAACLYEYHSTEHQRRCRAACEKSGLRLVRHDAYNPNQGTDIWVR